MERLGTTHLGLALGGGTARGMAHVGVLKGLAAAGETPGGYAGSSFGAIVAAMAASGLPPSEIERIVRGQDLRALWVQALDVGLHRGALVDGGRLADWLDRTIFGGARIEDCEWPLAIAATDLLRGEPVILRRGSIAAAVRASSALPGIFAPVPSHGRFLVDGGFSEPVPFAALAALGPARALGVHAGLNLDRSVALRRLRAIESGRAGRLVHRAAGRANGATVRGRFVMGLSLSLRSYRNDARAPRGAALLTVDPGVAWWDFHRAGTAIAAGERAVRRLLLNGRPVGAAVPADVATRPAAVLGAGDEEPA